MYPANSFNQVLEQYKTKEDLDAIVIELHETYGDKNRELNVPIELFLDIEYVDGTLIISFKVSKQIFGLQEDSSFRSEVKTRTIIYDWNRVREIQFITKPIITYETERSPQP